VSRVMGRLLYCGGSLVARRGTVAGHRRCVACFGFKRSSIERQHEDQDEADEIDRIGLRAGVYRPPQPVSDGAGFVVHGSVLREAPGKGKGEFSTPLVRSGRLCRAAGTAPPSAARLSAEETIRTAAAHPIDQQPEHQRRAGLRHPRRRADDAEAIGIVLRGRRSRAAASRGAIVRTPLPAPWKIANTPAAPAAEYSDDQRAPIGWVRQARRVENRG